MKLCKVVGKVLWNSYTPIKSFFLRYCCDTPRKMNIFPVGVKKDAAECKFPSQAKNSSRNQPGTALGFSQDSTLKKKINICINGCKNET